MLNLSFKKAVFVFLVLSLGLVTTIYAQQKEQTLWYQQPATKWEETLPLGNGRLGMTPDGGVSREHIILNDITLWSGAEQDANNYDAYKSLPEIRKLLFEGKNKEAQDLVDKNFICTGKGSGDVPFGCFQMLGDLQLSYSYEGSTVAQVESKLKYTNYHRSLLLNEAIANASFELNGVHYKREYFTSFDHDVAIIRLTADKPGQINCEIALTRPERSEVRVEGQVLEMSGQLESGTDEKGMRYQANVKAVLDGGKLNAADKMLTISGANSVTLYISAGTDFKDPDFLTEIKQQLDAAVGEAYMAERATHIKNFQKLYNRVRLNIGGQELDPLNTPTDQRLKDFQLHPDADNDMATLFFQFGRYLSISSTRVGLLPPNLQGLWANQIHTPWNGDYHLDVNVEMNHWPVDVTNLSELDLPLADLVKGMVPNGEKTARAYYNAKGWVAHVITNPWHFTEPGESASWGVTKSGSGWLCNNLWQHYDFTGDLNYLRKIYPVLKGSARFYNSILVRDPETGWMVTSPSSSPENSFYLPNGEHASICIGPTIDNQILHELFSNVITAARLLHVDQALSDSLQAQLKRIPPVGQIAKDGRLMEWLKDYKETEVHHRHISHLYGLFPANLITPEKTPKLAEAAKKTLEARGDDGPGWSIAYKMLWWSRLHDGNHAYLLLKNLLRPTFSTDINYGAGGGVYPNLFAAGPPFQIDANFGGEAAIAEMLLQSHAGFIELLPALPTQWKTSGAIEGLKARGNYTVDFRWKDGKVTDYKIKSPKRQLLKVKVNGVLKSIWSVRG